MFLRVRVCVFVCLYVRVRSCVRARVCVCVRACVFVRARVHAIVKLGNNLQCHSVDTAQYGPYIIITITASYNMDALFKGDNIFS